MSRYIFILFLLGIGLSMLTLSGCEKKKEVDLQDWSMPNFDKKHETPKEKVVEEEAEPAYTEPEPVTYTVRKGDTLYEIAKRYDVPPEQLAEGNGLALKGPKSVIYPGQELTIPVNKNSLIQ